MKRTFIWCRTPPSISKFPSKPSTPILARWSLTSYHEGTRPPRRRDWLVRRNAHAHLAYRHPSSSHKSEICESPNHKATLRSPNAGYALATAKWGEGWYTPTLQQWKELIEYCDWDYVMINGIHGVLFTSRKTYNTIFLPSTGYTDDQTYKLIHTTYNQAYWTSTGLRNDGAHTYIANYEQGYLSTSYRYVGRCVRAVCTL